jgi:DNA helicase-2/ATP-dependent DNA helicase PcrA
MTRAEEELVLTHCRLREFRGQMNYAIPSMFLEEMPESVEAVDLSSSGAAGPRAMDVWRSGTSSASRGWYDTGAFAPRVKATADDLNTATATASTLTYVEGMLVQHDAYGVGRVTAVSGHGVMSKVKIRFTTGGERTFFAAKAKLLVVQKG